MADKKVVETVLKKVNINYYMLLYLRNTILLLHNVYMRLLVVSPVESYVGTTIHPITSESLVNTAILL